VDTCFRGSDAPRLIALAATKLNAFASSVLLGCGATRVSVMASLRETGEAFSCPSIRRLSTLERVRWPRSSQPDLRGD
jgi:ribonuclease PH